MAAATQAATPGSSERDIAAEICSAMIRAGSDLPGPGVLSSGERAFHLHGGYTDRVLSPGDVVQVECTPNVRHYHARFMRPIKAGAATDADHRLAETLIAIQDTALAAVKPGVCAAVPDRLYRDGVLNAGLARDVHEQDILLRRPHPAAQWWRTAGGNTRQPMDLCAQHGLSHLCSGARLRHVRNDRHHGIWLRAADDVSPPPVGDVIRRAITAAASPAGCRAHNPAAPNPAFAVPALAAGRTPRT